MGSVEERIARLEMQVKGLEKSFEHYTLQANGIERERIGSLKEAAFTAKLELDARLKNASEELGMRLEHMNEFRHQIEQERGEYVTRKEIDLILDPIKKFIYHRSGSLEQSKDTTTRNILIIAIVVPIVMSLILRFAF